jgi:hypothetical protein
VGRFLGLDPVDGDPLNPATLHRYVYTENNPTNLTDSSGKEADIVGIEATTAEGSEAAAGQAIVSGTEIEEIATVALEDADLAEIEAESGEMAVYVSQNSVGEIQHVGITNDLLKRAAQHLATKEIMIQPLLYGLTRSDARAVEQA